MFYSGTGPGSCPVSLFLPWGQRMSIVSFHVRFCQATFATFSCFSYIWSAILLTYVAIGVVCCQNQNLLYLCSCSSKDIFLHFTPAAGKPSFPTFHRPRTFQTFADNMPHAKKVWIRGLYLKVSDAIRNQEFYRVASMFKNLFFYSPWKWRWISQPFLRHRSKTRKQNELIHHKLMLQLVC